MQTTQFKADYRGGVSVLDNAPALRDTAIPAERSNIYCWMLVTFVLFTVLALLGLYMRVVQAGGLADLQSWFYPMMTLHGLGMSGIWFAGAMACAADVLRKHVQQSEKIATFALVGTVAGVVLLLVSIFLGKFAAGWYFLYPLPLRGEWPAWSATTFLLGVTVLGATWLIWCLDVLRAIVARYTLPHALGWHYFRGQTEPAIPPPVLITAISMIAAVTSLVSGVILLLLFFFELLTGRPNDALLMKNLTFLFGHTLVNLAMYLALAVVYDVLPAYTGRPWKTNKIVVISWNSVLLIVLLAYFHHLYMDFVQPGVTQFLGQIGSYAAAIPAAVVTLFGALLLIYRAPVRWNLVSVLLVLGLMGWAIGGVGAVIDSTISANVRLHNTMWVPAHFHTYMLAGLGIIAAYFYHCGQQVTARVERTGYQIALIGVMVAGACGFLSMFYLSGAYSVPRRFAAYPSELAHGTGHAAWASAFAVVLLLGIVLCVIEVIGRWRKGVDVAAGDPAQ